MNRPSAVSAELGGAGGRCANCGATLAGAYCAMCGQRAEPHIHTLWGFTREATESLTHADSRFWRTLTALLLRPGRLTREFLNGRRASYLPPFRLYLVVSLLFFVVASLLGAGDDLQIKSSTDASAPVTPGNAEKARAPLAELSQEAERLAASKDPEERAAGEQLGEFARGKGKRCDFRYGGPWQDYWQPRFQSGCERALADGGRAFGRQFMANVPRVLFLFLPLIAFVMLLMYWRPRRHYVEHLLFFVHNHAFVFTIFMLLMLVSAPLPDAAGDLLLVATVAYAAWYLFRSMRVVYGQGRWLTFAKYSTLVVVYAITGSILTALAIAYSIATF